MTRGRLHLPGVHQQWRSPGGMAPAGGKIYTDFPEDAVARLRAANKSTQPAQTPRRNGKAMKPKKSEWKAKRPAPAPTPTAQAEPASPPQAKPLVTLEAFEGGSNQEKGAFIRRHFPDWLAYQEKHGLPRQEMLALTGVAGSVWYNHQLGYRKHPERYGEPKPEPVAVVDEVEAEPTLNETEESLQQALAEVQAEEVHTEMPPAKTMSTATAVGKIRELTELVGELRAAGAVVQVSVNWTMEL